MCLDLLEGSGPTMSLTLYGRPTAAELVAAVADFLDSDVREATEGQVSTFTPASRRTCFAPSSANWQTTEPCPTCWASTTRNTWLPPSGPAISTDGPPNCCQRLRTLVRHRLAVAHPGYDEST